MIGPRLIDPKAKVSYFVDLFRFSEDKSVVEDILKARVNTLNATAFNRVDNSKVLGVRGRGGRGGSKSPSPNRNSGKLSTHTSPTESPQTSRVSVDTKSPPPNSNNPTGATITNTKSVNNNKVEDKGGSCCTIM